MKETIICNFIYSNFYAKFLSFGVFYWNIEFFNDFLLVIQKISMKIPLPIDKKQTICPNPFHSHENVVKYLTFSAVNWQLFVTVGTVWTAGSYLRQSAALLIKDKSTKRKSCFIDSDQSGNALRCRKSLHIIMQFSMTVTNSWNSVWSEGLSEIIMDL